MTGTRAIPNQAGPTRLVWLVFSTSSASATARSRPHSLPARTSPTSRIRPTTTTSTTARGAASIEPATSEQREGRRTHPDAQTTARPERAVAEMPRITIRRFFRTICRTNMTTARMVSRRPVDSSQSLARGQAEPGSPPLLQIPSRPVKPGRMKTRASDIRPSRAAIPLSGSVGIPGPTKGQQATRANMATTTRTA